MIAPNVSIGICREDLRSCVPLSQRARLDHQQLTGKLLTSVPRESAAKVVKSGIVMMLLAKGIKMIADKAVEVVNLHNCTNKGV